MVTYGIYAVCTEFALVVSSGGSRNLRMKPVIERALEARA
jgi:hypothetical protein